MANNYQKEKLTKIYRAETDKEGKEFVGKDGIPYSKISVKIERLGDQWINGLGNFINSIWKEGETVEMEITEGEYNGKKTYDFKNFRHPYDGERRKMWKMLLELKGGNKKVDSENQTETIDPNDIPF